MIEDIFTVLWKERRTLFRDRSSRMRFLSVMLGPILLAIYIAWDAGPEWVESYISLLPACIVPVIIVAITIPDSFAGERERNTLETLLASRLSDKGIVFGKIVLPVTLGLGMTIVVLVLNLLIVNFRFWDGEFLLYPLEVLLADITFSLLLALLIAGVGVLISLRSPTVQDAIQLFMAVFLAAPILFGVFLLLFKEKIRSEFIGINIGQLLFITAIALTMAILGVYILVLSRFQRSYLCLK